jgi:hypothetical protein
VCERPAPIATGGEWGSGENMKKQFKNTKKEKAKWVEAEKILSAIESVGYDVHQLVEDFNYRPKQWTLVFSRKKKK